VPVSKERATSIFRARELRQKFLLKCWHLPTRLNGVTCRQSFDARVVRKVYAPAGRIAPKFEMFRTGVHRSVQLSFVQWHLVFVGRQYGTGLIPPF